MIVCLCFGVTDRDISKEIASGATSVEDIARSCQAGTACGSCQCTLEQMVEHGLKRRSVRCLTSDLTKTTSELSSEAASLIAENNSLR